ncbi:sugar MFS transporter [Flavitalea sp.]|nr:sugar MFS transporter [Flavitalea sp.]
MSNVNFPVVVLADPPGQGKSKYTPALISLAVLYFMLGFITCLNDTLVPFFKIKFKLNYAESSLVQFYFFLTYGIISIPAGRIIERVGYQSGMIWGFLITAAGALLFFPAAIFHEYYLFLAALLFLAAGIVFMQVSANPYIVTLGSPSTASARLNMIQSVGSVGTIVAPLFGAAVIMPGIQTAGSNDRIAMPYLGIAVTMLVISMVVVRLKLPKISRVEESNDSSSQKKNVFAFRNLRLGAIGIFFFVGIEIAVASFLTNYIADTLHIKDADANFYVAFYWGFMLLGRIIGVLLLKCIRPTTMLVANALIAMTLIMFSINTTGYVAVWTLLGVGLFNSVMFAIIFTLAVSGLGSYITKGSAILSTAICGGAVIVVLQGLLIDRSSWSTAFLIPMICYLYIIFYGLNGYKSKNSEYVR